MRRWLIVVVCIVVATVLGVVALTSLPDRADPNQDNDGDVAGVPPIPELTPVLDPDHSLVDEDGDPSTLTELERTNIEANAESVKRSLKAEFAARGIYTYECDHKLGQQTDGVTAIVLCATKNDPTTTSWMSVLFILRMDGFGSKRLFAKDVRERGNAVSIMDYLDEGGTSGNRRSLTYDALYDVFAEQEKRFEDYEEWR